MKSEKAVILANDALTSDIYRMVIRTDIADEVQAGQFVQVQVPGFFLRRPISVHEAKGGMIVLIYKVVGEGTAKLAELEINDEVDVFGPLGYGFPIEEREVVLIGGGVGIPPLYETAKRYRALHQKVTVVLGFNTKDQMFLEKEFRKIGCEVITATMDGSCGVKGTVMDAMEENNVSKEYVLACGPLPMLKAVAATCKGYVSLEARMACGLGACMGCVVKDEEGNSFRVCKDGPVFEIGKVVL